MSVRPAVIGIGLGLLSSAAAGRTIAALRYGIESTDPLTYGLTAVFLLGVTRAASSLPERRVIQNDPIVALRHE